MFGNKLGWRIAAVLAAALVALVWKLGQLNAMSPPSEGIVVVSAKVALNLKTRPELLEPIALPGDPLAVVPSMTDPTDAGPIYRRAMAEFDKNDAPYDPNERTGRLRSENIKDLPAVAALLEATNCAKMNLFAADPGKLIINEMQPKDVEKLRRIGEACNLLGLSIQPTDKQQAIKYYEATFSLGYKMVTERIRWPEFFTGWTLMKASAEQIARVDPSRTGAASFADACGKYYTDRVRPLFAVIPSIDPGVIGRTAGDIFYIVANSKERMWRVEAVMKLGHLRHDSGNDGRGADQRWAGIWARRIARDEKEDPVVRMAAKFASELTLEEHRMTR